MNRNKLLKFGGKSLSNGKGINQVIKIISSEFQKDPKLVVVLSARGNATNELENLLDIAKQGNDFTKELNSFKEYQSIPASDIDLSEEFHHIEKTLSGVSLLKDYSNKVKDNLLSYGELVSVKVVCALLRKNGIPALKCDSRDFICTDSNFGNASVLETESEKRTIAYFNNKSQESVPVVSGFISSNSNGETTTLGRNGSNLTTSLLAKYLNIPKIESFTHIDGIYTADPDVVPDAGIIDSLSYQEANDLASFGATILHSKTISPLEKANISLEIKNTYAPTKKGTTINGSTAGRGIKAITVKKNLCLINIRGNGLIGRTGIDARVFTVMSRNNISIGLISQGSTERGVGFLISTEYGQMAVELLTKEFEYELAGDIIGSINSHYNISAITVVGINLGSFNTAYDLLVKNNINILLISNNISGNNISLVVYDKDVEKTSNLIHSRIFGFAKKINIAVIGKGTVGGCLIDQIVNGKDQILKRKGIQLNIFAIAGKSNLLMSRKGLDTNWRENYPKSEITSDVISQIIEFANIHHLENLIVIDNTADNSIASGYTRFVENGFDLISSNKIANTGSYRSYIDLRRTLKKYNRDYLYETNVGAGLPLIDTIKLLHDSGENITRIKGVFSGSLSFIFNTFSKTDKPMSIILKEAIELGLTEPDPREDLSGNDVARKLLILARELELENEFKDIEIESLIPEDLRDISSSEFLSDLTKLDSYYERIKGKLNSGQVLRYVGDLYGDLQKSTANLKVKLETVSLNSALGQVTKSDSIFEIYTESYGNNPIVIQGAGAGAEVTARGVLGDLLRIAERR